MAEDAKLAVDESERITQHEAIKGDVRDEIRSRIAENREDRLTEPDRARVDAVAGRLRHKAVDEVARTEAEIEVARRFARVSQVADYLFYIIYGIISLEIILELFGARESSGFKRFMDTIAAPILAPFKGLMWDPSRGPFRLMLSYMFALVVYILLHLAVNGLLRMMVHKKTVV